MIEFSSISFDWDTLEELGEWSTLVKPEVMISADITTRTQITNAMVADAPGFRGVAERIKELVEGSDVVIAHNATFDQEMIDMEFEKLHTKIKWPRLICTVEQTAAIKGRRMNLSELHEHFFGEKFSDAHRAEADTRALLRIVFKLREEGYL